MNKKESSTILSDITLFLLSIFLFFLAFFIQMHQPNLEKNIIIKIMVIFFIIGCYGASAVFFIGLIVDLVGKLFFNAR